MKLRSTSGVLSPLFALSIVVGVVAEPAIGQVSADRFAGMPARSIGPAGTVGRISTIDAVVSDLNVVYVGAATGGLWKSVNGGQTWRAIFDDQPVSAIGTVAVSQANPDVVWVGIGEGNGTADPTMATVYRSLDGGETWAARGLVGLEGVKPDSVAPWRARNCVRGCLGSDMASRGRPRSLQDHGWRADMDPRALRGPNNRRFGSGHGPE